MDCNHKKMGISALPGFFSSQFSGKGPFENYSLVPPDSYKFGPMKLNCIPLEPSPKKLSGSSFVIGGFVGSKSQAGGTHRHFGRAQTLIWDFCCNKLELQSCNQVNSRSHNYLVKSKHHQNGNVKTNLKEYNEPTRGLHQHQYQYFGIEKMKQMNVLDITQCYIEDVSVLPNKFYQDILQESSTVPSGTVPQSENTSSLQDELVNLISGNLMESCPGTTQSSCFNKECQSTETETSEFPCSGSTTRISNNYPVNSEKIILDTMLNSFHSMCKQTENIEPFLSSRITDDAPARSTSESNLMKSDVSLSSLHTYSDENKIVVKEPSELTSVDRILNKDSVNMTSIDQMPSCNTICSQIERHEPFLFSHPNTKLTINDPSEPTFVAGTDDTNSINIESICPYVVPPSDSMAENVSSSQTFCCPSAECGEPRVVGTMEAENFVVTRSECSGSLPSDHKIVLSEFDRNNLERSGEISWDGRRQCDLKSDSESEVSCKSDDEIVRQNMKIQGKGLSVSRGRMGIFWHLDSSTSSGSEGSLISLNADSNDNGEGYSFDSISSQNSVKSGKPKRSISECSADSDDSFIVFDTNDQPGDEEENNDDSSESSSDGEYTDDEDSSEDENDGVFNKTSIKHQPGVHMSKSSIDCQKRKSTKKVRFAEGSSLARVRTMVVWNFASRRYRKPYWETVARDRARFNDRIARTGQILAPVLKSDHREQVFNRIYNKDNCD